MLRRFWLYFELAWLDLFRFRSASCLQALIVAGVCFPVLILLTLKRGHVEDLRAELVTSPTGSLVKIYPAAAGEPFTLAELDTLAAELGNVNVAIPYVRRIVDLSANDDAKLVQEVDVFATRPGDPMMKAQDADVLGTGEKAIVLYDSVAEELDVNVGSEISLTVERLRTESESGNDIAAIDLSVKAIISASSEDKIGFVDATLIDRITRFQRGGGVPEWNWPSMPTSPKERYPTFLLVNDASDPLRDPDFEALENLGFSIQESAESDERSLAGTVPSKNHDKIVVYRLTRSNSVRTIRSRMSDNLLSISRSTIATDAAIPWCRPRTAMLGDEEVKLVGLTFPPRCKWLHNLILQPDLPFGEEDDYCEGRLITTQLQRDSESKVLQLNGAIGLPINLTYLGDHSNQPTTTGQNDVAKILLTPSAADSSEPSLPKGDSYAGSNDHTHDPRQARPRPPKPVEGVEDPRQAIPRPPAPPDDDFEHEGGQLVSSSATETGNTKILATVVVPTRLLSYIDEYSNGSAAYDPQSQRLQAVLPEPTYEDALVFAATIDDVPEIVANAVERDFPFNAQNARIEEIQKQDGSLQRLVLIVGILVFMFGVLTVFGVLWESTARKHNVIGIMRVMGVTPFGVFIIVIIRALLIGAFAALITIAFGYVSVLLLTWEPDPSARVLSLKPVISAFVHHRDLYVIVCGSIGCCVIGSLVPAVIAGRLDPFDAIVQGRYR